VSERRAMEALGVICSLGGGGLLAEDVPCGGLGHALGCGLIPHHSDSWPHVSPRPRVARSGCLLVD
jgi:hypothetical protein